MKSAVVVLALVALLAAPALACPNCKDANASSVDEGQGNQMGKGFFYSILTMLGTMGLVLFGLIRMLVQASRGVADLPPEAAGVESPPAS